MFGPKFRQVAKDMVRSTIELGSVLFFFVLCAWYWRVDEHAVYLALAGPIALLGIARVSQFGLNRSGWASSLTFVAFLFWILLSTSWSGSPRLTLTYAVLTVIIGLTSLIIGFAFSLKTVMLGIGLGTLLLVFHASTIPAANEDWTRPFGVLNILEGTLVTGLFTNPQSTTFLIGAAVVSLLWVPLKTMKARLLSISAVIFLLVLAEMKIVLTMWFATFGALVVAIMVLHIRHMVPRYRLAGSVSYASAVILAGVAFWFFREPVLKVFDEGPDLSGRTILWDWYFEAFLWNPIIGIGWGRTYGWPIEPGNVYPTGQYFHAHNGFIDIGLALGSVGVLLMLATLILLFVNGARIAIQRQYSAGYIFFPAMVAYLTLNDLMISTLPSFIGLFLVGVMAGSLLRSPDYRVKIFTRDHGGPSGLDWLFRSRIRWQKSDTRNELSRG